MVSLPKLSNCCACISLKTGTLIIGALNLVACVIAIIASIGTMAMAGLEELVDGMELALDQNMPEWRNNFDKQDISSGIFIVGFGMLVVSIFLTVISACLVHGTRTRNACLMKPWIVLSAIGLILQIFYILGAFIFLAIGAAIYHSLNWVLWAYFFLVVWSFKAEVEEGAGGDYQGQVHYKREEREMLKA